ncbi:MAG: hypothetical protein RLZZ350_1042, partial [Verrucomicrobiota bacterium]
MEFFYAPYFCFQPLFPSRVSGLLKFKLT